MDYSINLCSSGEGGHNDALVSNARVWYSKSETDSGVDSVNVGARVKDSREETHCMKRRW